MPPKARTAKVISKLLPTFDNDDAIAIDEPLPGLSSLTAGHQTWELSSQTPVTIPQTVESPASHLTGPHTLLPLHALAPMWESPPTSPASMPAYTTPAQPPLASLASAWQSPSLSPASDPSPPSMAPLQLSNVISPLQLSHPVTMLAGPQISHPPEVLPHPQHYITLMPMITQMNIEHPTTQSAVDLAQDGLIIAAYNHYANTLVEASWQYQLLLERRAKLEAMMQECSE
ncbi:hypothetical protein V8B97DRAFT_1921104 [Scleroderma yunnanense]